MTDQIALDKLDKLALLNNLALGWRDTAGFSTFAYGASFRLMRELRDAGLVDVADDIPKAGRAALKAGRL